MQTKMTRTATTLTGHAAIAYARREGVSLAKRTDPTEGARDGLSVEEAEAIAAEDPSLVWLEVEPTDEQIAALESEAGTVGDLEMVEVCRRALDGDPLARAESARAIAAAAMAD